MNPDAKGNIRDTATIEQLIVLSNLESMNAVFIREGLSQSERLFRLNQIAIFQLQSLWKESLESIENLKKLLPITIFMERVSQKHRKSGKITKTITFYEL